MDSLQKQVSTLGTKVDALQLLTEQLNHQVAQILSEIKSGPGAGSSNSAAHGHLSYSSYQRHQGLDATLEHKDVLVDSNYPHAEEQTGEQELAPEIQIRRLTAQLTAAYNRIAALEEQLLAKRVYSS
jgi:hypothetical protein